MKHPCSSFAPLEPARARVLILGSMPGVASLQAGQYYAHPRNAFWPIMGALYGAGPELPYPQRVARLLEAGVALWDVLQYCERVGSLDSAIARKSEVPNDIPALLARQPGIGAVALNGGAAARLFARHFPALLARPGVQIVLLPSTSPAHAARTMADKLQAWRALERGEGPASSAAGTPAR